MEPAESLRRAPVRDAEPMGGEAAVMERYTARYLPAQSRYVVEAEPMRHADLVVDNTDPAAPRVLAG